MAKGFIDEGTNHSVRHSAALTAINLVAKDYIDVGLILKFVFSTKPFIVRPTMGLSTY